VVFVLTGVLATNQIGLAESALGVVGIMIASGLGLLATVTARRRPIRFAACVAAVLAASSFSRGPSGRLIRAERSFYGVVRVTYDSESNAHRLFHGTTLHGQQSLDPVVASEPSTYFTRSGPIGQVFHGLGPQLRQTGSRVAILGLGAGTLASYAQTQQQWTFYEIDSVIARIAKDPRLFTYLRDCRAETVEIVLGDARLRLREAPEHEFGLIVLDAFSSDSLPVHLLSREAIGLYRSKLSARGILAFNLSNRYLDLEPVVGRQAADAGLLCRVAYDVVVSSEEKQSGKQPSVWAVMAEAEDDFGGLTDDPRWRVPRLRPGSAVWTDDFSDLASTIRWSPLRTWIGAADASVSSAPDQSQRR
jgi:spermidine synthase